MTGENISYYLSSGRTILLILNSKKEISNIKSE